MKLLLIVVYILNVNIFFVQLINATNSDGNLCRYRDVSVLYPETPFKYLTGASCYIYINKAWLNTNITVAIKPKNITESNVHYPISYGIINNNTEVIFDYSNESYSRLINSLFVNDLFYEKWKMCATNADNCCKNHLNADNIYPTIEYPCPALWDGFTCYDKAKPSSTIYSTCPLYTTSQEEFTCNLQSEKYCLETGWNHRTNYLVCSSSIVLRRRHKFHISVLIIASIIILPSLIIFYSFRELKKLKFTMHRTLITAIILKNLLVIISKSTVILDAINSNDNSIMEMNTVWCKMLAFAENLSKNLIFTCMTADAFYLHRIIAHPFKDSAEDSIFVYILIAIASVSIIPTIIWSIFMHLNQIDKCWMVLDNHKWIQWITDGFKYGMLIINLLLLLDIIRALATTIGKTGSNQNDRKTAGRVISILLPLFGLPLLISSQRGLVNMKDCLASDIYLYVTYSIEALQGVFLATYFCYFNADVRKEVSNFMQRQNEAGPRVTYGPISSHMRETKL